MDQKQKILLIAAGALCGLIVLFLAFRLAVSIGAASDSRAELKRAERTIAANGAERPYPSKENRDTREQDAKAAAAVADQARALLTHGLPIPQGETVSQFADRLVKGVHALNERQQTPAAQLLAAAQQQQQAQSYSFESYVAQGNLPKDKDLPRLGKILEVVVRAVRLPVTFKTRLGPHPGAPVWREVIHIARESGVAAVTLHARFTSQGHAGTVHLDLLRQAVEAAGDLPVFGNGSVVDRPSAEAMAATGVRALLIARAALENPCVFSFSKGAPCDLAERHLDLELRYRALAQAFSRLTPEEATVLTFRKHLFRYFKGLPGANALRGRLMDLHTVADLRAAIAAFRQ